MAKRVVCRGKSTKTCKRHYKKCKVASGTKRTFCRKRRNTTMKKRN